MARQTNPTDAMMVDLIAQAIAEADGIAFETDPFRFRRMAVAALSPMAKPTEAMVDAAHEAASFDAHWAINSRRDFKKAVKAMVTKAKEECDLGETGLHPRANTGARKPAGPARR